MSHFEKRSHSRRARTQCPQAREDLELTRKNLPEKSGLDPTYISDIDRGRRNPGIKNVAKLAKALDLTTSELCKGVDA